MQALETSRANAAHFEDIYTYWSTISSYCGMNDSDCSRDRDSDCGKSLCEQSMPTLTTMSSSTSHNRDNFNYFTGVVEEPKEHHHEEHHLLQS